MRYIKLNASSIADNLEEISGACSDAGILAENLRLIEMFQKAQEDRNDISVEMVLDKIRLRLQQHDLHLVFKDKMILNPDHIKIVEEGLTSLWAHVCAYHLQLALHQILESINFIPRALLFWKKRKKRFIKTTIELGPFEWFIPRSQKMSIEDRLNYLESIFETNLIKAGMIKRNIHSFTQEGLLQKNLEKLINQGYQLLNEVFSCDFTHVPSREPTKYAKPSFASFSPSISTTNTVPSALNILETTMSNFLIRQEDFSSTFELMIAPYRPPTKLRQRWLHVSLLVVGLGAGGIWIVNNKQEFHQALGIVSTALKEFFSEHMMVPSKAIFEEIFLNKTSKIQDAAAVLDTKLSLQRMLGDFVHDTSPGMSPSDIQNVMDTMDMSVVSLQYEKQLSHALKNIVTGDIVRMLLIQVQFIKKELMVAMGAIDELMHANQLNLQVLATIPTFIVFGGMYAGLKGMTYQIFKRTSEQLHYDPAEVATQIRNNLRDIERLLNLQNRPDWKKRQLHDCQNFDDRQMGHLLLLLYHLKKVFELHRDLLDEEEQDRFEEDINDLMEEGLHVSQQLAVIQRMYHSHPFLQRSRRSMQWLLG